jgi:hypothetical protein
VQTTPMKSSHQAECDQRVVQVQVRHLAVSIRGGMPLTA